MLISTGKGNHKKFAGVSLSQQQIDNWETHFVSLGKYKEEHGDCDVPTNSPEYKVLGEWVKRQRKVYRRFHSNNSNYSGDEEYLFERFKRLKNLGFKFSIGSGRGKKDVVYKDKKTALDEKAVVDDNNKTTVIDLVD